MHLLNCAARIPALFRTDISRIRQPWDWVVHRVLALQLIPLGANVQILGAGSAQKQISACSAEQATPDEIKAVRIDLMTFSHFDQGPGVTTTSHNTKICFTEAFL